MDIKIYNQINAKQISLQIIMRLRRINQEMLKHSEIILEKYKFSTPQPIYLNEVFQHGPITIGALTKIVSFNNSTVIGIVDGLEKRELVLLLRQMKTPHGKPRGINKIRFYRLYRCNLCGINPNKIKTVINGHLTFCNLGQYVRYHMVIPTISRQGLSMQDFVCCDYFRTPVIFQGLDIYSFVVVVAFTN